MVYSSSRILLYVFSILFITLCGLYLDITVEQLKRNWFNSVGLDIANSIFLLRSSTLHFLKTNPASSTISAKDPVSDTIKGTFKDMASKRVLPKGSPYCRVHKKINL